MGLKGRGGSRREGREGWEGREGGRAQFAFTNGCQQEGIGGRARGREGVLRPTGGGRVNEGPM